MDRTGALASHRRAANLLGVMDKLDPSEPLGMK